ncbi:NAD(P)/FAD-dependent oxidoreductase [Halalkalibacillus halophilus]|uniref:NAD(P)/FAD-dependent oxidoreductase n=1 Tax=Halalkalibacillus halophilus TaxID=392827 RepID=UPI0004107B18|nr:FAD-dependent oxidoreductase [Halalkalibacillus halophilus]
MIVIIGGGILGASTAYHLAKKGEKVTLIDRKDDGQATEAAAGIVCPWLSQRRNKAWYRLVKGGARYYPELVKALEADGQTDTGYRQVGTLSLHTDQDKLQKVAERARKRREDAPEIGEIEILTSEETRERFPLVNEAYGSVFVSGGARVNGKKMRDALLQAARGHGAIIKMGDARFSVENGAVQGVSVKGDFNPTDKVIDTSGAWSKQLIQPLDVNFEVSSQRAQLLQLQLPDEVNSEGWPVIMPPNNSYVLSLAHGKIIVGATRTDTEEFDYRATAGAIHEILGKAIEVAPSLENSQLIETRVGFRPYTPGFLPVIGRLPGYENVYVANGLGASGLTSGPYLGAELARFVASEETELDFKDYDVNSAIPE